MGQKWQNELIKILGTAVFLTAVFFAGRQAAVMTAGFRESRRAESQNAQETEKKSRPMQKFCVVVDAGHGGFDPGKVGVNGAEEKNVNLVIAGKLAVLLEQADVKVVMTREDENGLYDEDASRKKVQDMKRRIVKIEEAQPDLVVSIHQNSYEDPAIHGAQTFYYTESAEGKELAERIQKQLVEKLDPENHRAAKANSSYYLLKKTTCPIVIVECGFLSNPTEAGKLCNPIYQEQAAWQIQMGILQYLNGTVHR